ncbi:MAG: AbrB/MazE/SpoVT family DNA-binding domain-containing protein, partial [Desulfoferrobacter sp.]
GKEQFSLMRMEVVMQGRICRWGNSLAIRIPAMVATELGVDEDSQVELAVSEGQLTIRPVQKRPKYRLEELLEDISENNLHGETSTGSPIGREIW